MSSEPQAQPAIPVKQSPFFPERKWARLLRDSDVVGPKAILLGLLIATWADSKTAKMDVSIPRLRTFCVNEKGQPVAARTIIRWRQELVQAGFLECVEKGNGKGHRSVYRLVFPASANGDTDVAQTVTSPLPQTVTFNVTRSAGEVHVLRPAGEPGQDQRDGSDAQDRDLVQVLEQQLGQISPTGHRVIREALSENEPGVLRCVEKAKSGMSPAGLLVKMLRDGEHRLSACPCCGNPKPDVRDIAPDLRARGDGPAGEFRACGDCARMHFGL
jgi:hypothetical protein